jgi:hypothetical protein
MCIKLDARRIDGGLLGVYGREGRMDVDGGQLLPALLRFDSHLGVAPGLCHGSVLPLRTNERRRARGWDNGKSSNISLIACPNLMPGFEWGLQCGGLLRDEIELISHGCCSSSGTSVICSSILHSKGTSFTFCNEIHMLDPGIMSRARLPQSSVKNMELTQQPFAISGGLRIAKNFQFVS